MSSEKLSDTLKDVVAFVDVWSSSRTENYSKPFILQLQEMGAEVSKTFDKHVTHVVFQNGHQYTWDKAKKMGVKLVSVLWVARCNDCGEHIDEELCPAVNEGSHRNPVLKKRTHRCMQPRDIPVKTPENNKLMKKKLDRMMKNLEVPSLSSSSGPDTSPFLIDEASGAIYSPTSQRARGMAQRLKVMKERRESLSRLDWCDEDDSSDLDTSISDFHSGSAGSKSEATKEEVQHPHKTPPFHVGTSRSDIEMNRSPTEFPRTDTKKQASVCHRAKKETAERPQGPSSETKRPEPQKLSNSSAQSSALECQTSLESPGPGVLSAEGVKTQSPFGLEGWLNGKRRESSFKRDQAEKARSQRPGVTELLESKSRSSGESNSVLNGEEKRPCGQTKASKVYSLFRACGRAVSLPVSAGESLIRKAAVGVRKRARCSKQASILQAFFLRKSASLTVDARGSAEPPTRPSTPPDDDDDGAFENYFSPVNRAENGRTASLGQPWKPIPFPPIEAEPKQRKRKRSMTEDGSPGQTRGKRRVSLSKVN